MTIEQMLQRQSGRESEVSDTDPIEDLGGYGLLRGIRDRAFALELRKKDDTVLAIPYALIEQFVYSPADGITLRASGREFRIRGRHLNQSSAKTLGLFVALTRQRVSWLVEQTRTTIPASDSSTVIESITW